ncbi:hypothetical protein HID58_087580 [Brassica napus]|uniref:BHLH domain-containing protein n=1 Tax=Brassica napus TaxID=3708 RepID=A0ABQ7XV25_BRANA|nr:hypothetical protein HID58_087580 [Brassica napus]
MQETILDFLEECEFVDTSLAGDDLFAILESLEGAGEISPTAASTPKDGTTSSKELVKNQNYEASSAKKKRKRLETGKEEEDDDDGEGEEEEEEDNKQDGQQKMSHVNVERNRRKQMNEHLTVLRSLMPCFYVKRGDQASIIGGVVEYISELQQVLQSLEAKKERKTYAEVLSPRLVPSPRPSPPVLSPRKPPISPRISHQHLLLHPISPRTPLPTSPYGGHPPQLPLIPQPPRSYSLGDPPPYSPASSSSSPSVSSNHESSLINELVANSKSALADVEVKFSGANVLLKTVSHKIPGQVMKIIAALEDLSLEILQVNINTVEETMLYSFTIKARTFSVFPLETEPPIPPPTKDKGYKCDPSLTLPPLLGCWDKPLKIVSDVGLNNQPLILPQEKPNKGILPPALKENGELRFPWAAKMNPQSPPCHFPDLPRGGWDSKTKRTQHVEAADTHTSLSVIADESSLPSTMGDQTESHSPATIPSCMAPVTTDPFIFGAVTLPPLDDDNHDFSETQEDEDQVSASSQRTLRERPVKQS